MNEVAPIRPPITRSKRSLGLELGQWRWVAVTDDDGKPDGERLLCVWHIASNHVVFEREGEGGWRIKMSEIEARTRIESNWQQIVQSEIEAKKLELAAAVQSMVDMVRKADLIQDEAAPPTLLPSTMLRDPVEYKKELVKLKEKNFPAIEKEIEAITKDIVCLHKDLCLGFKASAAKMKKTVETVDKKLFALEIYAGIGEGSKLIRQGKPAEPETPIAVRQMIRYMDEETLIDYDKGGMDFSDIRRFDKWISKPENVNRIAPEARCIVALQVRRHDKDYGRPSDLRHAVEMMEWHKANEWTYLLIRNGERIYRLATEIEFRPRLLPFRGEFSKPLEKDHYWSDEEKKPITPDDFDYDKAMEKRMNQVYEYNRVMFLIQGLLDRSKVFSPHPQINLAEQTHVEKYLRPIFDEEMGLPASNPPKWEEYRDKLNRTIKPGSLIYCTEGEEVREFNNRFGSWKRSKYGDDARSRPRIVKVSRVERDGKHLWIRWALGDRIKEEWKIDMSRPVPDKPGYYYRKRLEHNLGMRYGNQRVEVENCFAIQAYTLGDYKKFLCDAHLKGEYLRWSRQLLTAEDFQLGRYKKDDLGEYERIKGKNEDDD